MKKTRQLKASLSEYAATQAEFADVKAENDSACVKLSIKKRIYVIMSRFMRRSFPETRISGKRKLLSTKVEEHGIKKNMAVMTASGLIGKVVLVTPSTTSTVELLSTENRNFRVSAVVPGGEEKSCFWTYRRI